MTRARGRVTSCATLLACLLTLLAGGCVLQDQPSCRQQACTELFAMVTVTIVDSSDRPVDGLTTTTTNLDNGARVPTTSGLGSGIYVVVDDNFLREPREGTASHTLLFTAQGTDGTVNADYEIRARECDCHVEKLSGPDTLVLQR